MASGATLLTFLPRSFELPASDAAAPHVRNQHPTLKFDDATNESVIFSGIMPRHYGGGGITVYIHYAMSSASSGTVDWDAAFERIGSGQQDIDSDGFAAAQSADDNTVPGTCGHVAVAPIAFAEGAQMDSIAAGELFRLKITRDAASDNAAGDAELVAVELKET